MQQHYHAYERMTRSQDRGDSFELRRLPEVAGPAGLKGTHTDAGHALNWLMVQVRNYAPRSMDDRAAPDRVEEWIKSFEDYAGDAVGRGMSVMFSTHLHGGMYAEQTLLACPKETRNRCPRPPV